MSGEPSQSGNRGGGADEVRLDDLADGIHVSDLSTGKATVPLVTLERGFQVEHVPQVGHPTSLKELQRKFVVDPVKWGTFKLRRRYGYLLLLLFFLLNVAVVLLVWWLASFDIEMVRRMAQRPRSLQVPEASLRIVTPQVLMSLIGATVVQVGASMVIIVRYLFPERGSESD
jgi:hypothetical protein